MPMCLGERWGFYGRRGGVGAGKNKTTAIQTSRLRAASPRDGCRLSPRSSAVPGVAGPGWGAQWPNQPPWPYDHPAASWFNFLPLEQAKRHLSAPHYYPPSISFFSFIRFYERLLVFPPLLLVPPQSPAKGGRCGVCVGGRGVEIDSGSRRGNSALILSNQAASSSLCRHQVAALQADRRSLLCFRR